MSLRCLARNPSGPNTTIVLYSVPGRSDSRSLTPTTAWIPRVRHTAASSSISGPGTSTELSHIRSQSSSEPPNEADALAQIFDGYSDTKHSGSTASSTPESAASPSRRAALATLRSASRISGVAWTAATRTLRNTVMARPYGASTTTATPDAGQDRD